ncbi:MAG TPA: heparan-alpha-glucosaminide N-acetyltransferase domain-containing protein [Candidatus Polarisedimenticolaceae bacterium]|nr:heparan-alpha-glucosaminide N-acetyltransferase domain-containing protein [Candidatus Polarisedimenticolaceae bacterium]
MSARRIAALDVIRGAVMVLMAVDHVRVYSGVPAGGPSPAVFFTRWITHFCAPAFVFLAGTGAYLYGRRHDGLARFLLTRGAWLVLLELTVLRFAWTFNFDYAHYLLAGVIWVIGWCMILMAGLTRMPIRAIGIFGGIVIALHNAVGPFLVGLASKQDGVAPWLFTILYAGFLADPVGGRLMVLYSIIPWIGVMAAGYAFGPVMLAGERERRRICWAVGLSATALFVILRGLDLYGDPRPWGGAGPLAFLNTTKYPASLSFLLMTLGPTIALIPLAERSRGPLARLFAVFGRVPFFFYVLHIPLIHLLALLVSKVRLGAVSPWLFENHPMGNPPAPDGYTWSLPLLYAIWAIAVAALYLPCRWFAEVKERNPSPWLRYL